MKVFSSQKYVSFLVIVLTACTLPGNSTPTPNRPGTVGTYEAEAATLIGGAAVIGAADKSSRTIGDLAGEASARQAVTLTHAGDGLSFSVLPVHSGANAMVMRYSIPDLGTGGGQKAPLLLQVNRAGALLFQSTLTLNSRYNWLYGNTGYGVTLYNTPANAMTYTGQNRATHLYDEIQLKFQYPLRTGDLIKLVLAPNSVVTTIDFVELEIVPAALAKPASYLSITDPQCGAIPFDVNSTGEVFDGMDDSIYASVYHSVVGINPYAASNTQTKDYYTNAADDALQDTAGNARISGMSMFQLADHNYQSLLACVNTVLASSGTYTGVWIPPGRFYARGDFPLPDNISIKGAGIWYSKFSAVDTAPPTSVTANGKTGIAGTTGNLTLISKGGGLSNSSNVLLSDFSMFGNLTQRDTIDTGPTPHGVSGVFTNSTFNNLWIEHYLGGVLTVKVSTNVTYSGLRVRNTFGDGIDFYGNTSNSTITNSQVRNTGDDAFAIWSQLATGVSANNTISNCVAQLPWWGNGFAIYGGTNDTLINNQAYDTLTSSGLSVSTGFVAAGLPSSYVMQGTRVSNTHLYRCGGPDFGSQAAAVRVGVMTENVDSLTIDHLNIQDPTYHGVAIAFMPTTSPAPAEGTLTNFTLSNVQIHTTHACTDVNAPITGSAQLNNVCLCDPAHMTASSCTLNNSAAGTFQIQNNTCAQTTCIPF